MTEIVEIQLKNRVMARFSVRKPALMSETAYFGNMIELSKVGAKNYFGKMLRSGEKTIYYADAGQFKADLLNFTKPVFKIQV